VATAEPATRAAVHLERTVPAPREEVFRAWTDPDQVRKWFGPVYGSTPSVEMDVRVGGRYRVTMKPAVGSAIDVVGTFLEVEPPERLVYTFAWEPSSAMSVRLVGRLMAIPHMGETRVTVEFRDLGHSTEVSLTHEVLDKRRLRSFHRVGWTASLRRLALLLEPRDAGDSPPG
jgi:uncharacterized protein YndB with AHSA1/START domain